MKRAPILMLFAVLALGLFVGCARPALAPDVSDTTRKALNDAGLNDVSVRQDRDKGVVTLGGHVASDADKAHAEAVAKSLAGNQVVADEILVTPPGAEGDARSISSDLDKGIANNLDAAFIANKLKNDVSYDVKNGVVTLTGNVNSQGLRANV